jgi:teichoic acid transport system ATP-binding protein
MDASIAVKVDNLSKVYKLYERSRDRLKEAIHPFRKKYHKEFYALDNVSFEIAKGETIGIVGKNGSGKSTLLKIITGILTPTQGNVNINGRVSALLELGTGFNPELTGMENIYFNGTIMGFRNEEIDARLNQILDFADIGDFIHQPVKSYSSGMFLRLAFAVAVNVDPEILIVDEALAVGDMNFQLKCIEKMKSFKLQGKTIIFVSHDTTIVRHFCDTALWIKDGHIYRSGNVHAVIEEYQDFMKFGLQTVIKPIVPETRELNVVTIDRVSIETEAGRESASFKVGETFIVKIEFTLYRPFNRLLGGVALFDKQEVYICGLNTKLDSYELPCDPGRYCMTLCYTKSNLLPGSYFIDVGFFDNDVVVILDFRRRLLSFTVYSGEYFGDGILLLQHTWNCNEISGGNA